MLYDFLIAAYVGCILNQIWFLLTKKKSNINILDYKVLKDRHGAVGQPYKGGFEGGDSASWTGIYNYFTKRKGWSYSKFFQVGFGSYVRHPIKDSTYNKYGSYYKHPYDGNMNRDQLTGVTAGLINDGKLWQKIKFTLHNCTRLFLFAYNTRQNGIDPKKGPWKLPDLLDPLYWGMHIRMYRFIAIIINPVLEILDLHLLVSTLIVNKTSKDDCNNYLVRLHTARTISPTNVSALCVKLLDKKHLNGRLFEYWCFWRKQPGMYRLLSDIIKELK